MARARLGLQQLFLSRIDKWTSHPCRLLNKARVVFVSDESDHVISKRHSDSKEEEEDPPDLWVSIGDDDPVPDPSDIDAVMEYCWMRKNNFIANLYMVTREMMESGMEARPLATYQPFLFGEFVHSGTSLQGTDITVEPLYKGQTLYSRASLQGTALYSRASLHYTVEPLYKGQVWCI